MEETATEAAEDDAGIEKRDSSVVLLPFSDSSAKLGVLFPTDKAEAGKAENAAQKQDKTSEEILPAKATP